MAETDGTVCLSHIPSFTSLSLTSQEKTPAKISNNSNLKHLSFLLGNRVDVMSSTWVFRLVRFDSPLHLRGGQLGLGAADDSRADRTRLLDLEKKRNACS